MLLGRLPASLKYMELLIAILGFIGSWLLFTGSVYQASLELREQDIDQKHFDEVRRTVEAAPPVSPLWWFLPPVKWYLEQQRSLTFREQFMSVLSPEDIEALVNFMNRANGWLIVAGGGWLLAIKETYEASAMLELSPWYVLALLIVMTLLSILYTVISARRSKGMLANAQPAD